MEFSAEQRKAVSYCTDTKRRVVAITGPAGSGKTTIMRIVVRELRAEGRDVCLCAPTGRAARRILEATGYPAITIHKMLGYGKPQIDEDTGIPSETLPSFHHKNRLPYDDIIVDEYMMVPEALHRDLMDAMKPGARLLTFGDVQQLPPIEPHELQDIKDAPFERLLKLPSSVTLDTVYRQEEGSGVLDNARRIRAGKPPTKSGNFSLQISEVPIKHLMDHVTKSGINYTSLENQIISPVRKGPLGVHALNTVLQTSIGPQSMDVINLPRDRWEKHEVKVHVGDKVICNENIYDLRDFFERFSRWKDEVTPEWDSFIPCPDSFMILNGEIGVIDDILPDGTLYISFPDRTVTMPSSFRDYLARYNRIYERDPRKKLDLAYAVTTHKMQGSECKYVVYLMHRSISYAINRNNLYTAITRAKEGVYLITDSSSLMSGPRLTAAEKEKLRGQKQKGFSVGDMKS